jgi:hypothetical protein
VTNGNEYEHRTGTPALRSESGTSRLVPEHFCKAGIFLSIPPELKTKQPPRFAVTAGV